MSMRNAIYISFWCFALANIRLAAQNPQRHVSDQPPVDAIQDAQLPREAKKKRPEQSMNDHDVSNIFSAKSAAHGSDQLNDQPEMGQVNGFDFYRDPLNAAAPNQSFADTMKADIESRPGIMKAQRELLEARYLLEPRFADGLKMHRGKPIPIGPTARLKQDMSWTQLAQLKPEEIKEKGVFPYPSLPHPKHVTGGQVFPAIQIEQFQRLERFDVEFDLPEAFLPEFPPAIFLQNRPELGDVSRGEVLSINNYYRLFKDLLTPVQLDGLRLLLTPLPQEEFNPTDDRKTLHASLGVACLDCHVNGHTTGQFHLTPDIRPQHRRFRLDTTSLRGVIHQQIHGSKRGLRSVEDFTEFEQRTAYFNGDPIHAMKKGLMILDRVQVSHMAQMQSMFDFPPAPLLDESGKLDRRRATMQELRGEEIFFGKGRCAQCHPAPYFLDHQMHDLHLERFLNEPPDGPIKSFTLRGIKESPPYMHDGRCLTLEDTVEFFNLVLGLELDPAEKQDLTAYLRQL